MAIGEARCTLIAAESLDVEEVEARPELVPLARVEAAAEPVLGAAGKGAVMPPLAVLGMRPGMRRKVNTLERTHWPAFVSSAHRPRQPPWP